MLMDRRPARGFSLMELLVVLAILAVLVLAGVRYLGSGYTNAVVAVTNQVEATLYAAQRATTTTLTTVDVTATGSWTDRNFVLAYTGAAPADVFRYVQGQPDFQKAGIDPTTDGWPSGLGDKPALSSASDSLAAPVVAALDKPMLGLSGAKVSVTATRKEFGSAFFIAVVPVDSQGRALYSGPAGLVVVEGHRIFKYLRSEKNKPWRRA